MIAYMTIIKDPKQLSLFEQILETYQDDMFRKAYRILRDYHWAEDAVAEAFLKIAKNIEKISSLSCQKRGGYLVILTKNCAIDLARRHHLQEVPIDFIEELKDREAPVNLEEAVFQQEGYARLIQAIEDLDPKYRDPMQMYYLYHHKVEEIAELFGLQENTVHARLSRGRKKLAEALAREEEGSKP